VGEKENPGRSLSELLNARLLDALTGIAELRVELRVSLKAMEEKIDRVLLLEQKVEDQERQITRIKTLWSVLAAGIALAVVTLKDWLFGQK
jgi:hypothetical protein